MNDTVTRRPYYLQTAASPWFACPSRGGCSAWQRIDGFKGGLCEGCLSDIGLRLGLGGKGKGWGKGKKRRTMADLEYQDRVAVASLAASSLPSSFTPFGGHWCYK